MAWNPTHVQVAVQRAKDLISKGKSGTNDVFVTIALNKEKFQTSLKAKATDPEWYEECDLLLPADFKESTVEIVLLHRNALGIDEFLGRLDLPLSRFSILEPPKAQWYKLLSKPGHNKNKERGELEVRLAFIVSKVKDPDSISTASSASKRLKSGKKMIKHAADIIGGKLGVKKKDKTTDHIPDIAGVDEGVLNTGDISENYSLSSVGKKGDTLSLPPGSPKAKHSADTSKKQLLLVQEKEGKKQTTLSVHGSSNDLTADSSADSGFKLGHRRAASSVGPQAVVDAKPPKSQNFFGKRGLLSKEKSASTWEVTTTSDEFGSSGGAPSVGDARISLFDKLDPPKSGRSGNSNGNVQNADTSNQRRSGPALVVEDYSDDIAAYIKGAQKTESTTAAASRADVPKPTAEKGTYSRQESLGSGSGSAGARADEAGGGGTSGTVGKLHGLVLGSFGIAKEKVKDEVVYATAESQAQNKRSQAGGVQSGADGSDRIPTEFRNLAKEVLVDMVVKMRAQLKKKEDHVHDLEDYIDRLLLRVMAGNPGLLQVPPESTAEMATMFGRK